MCDCRKRVEKKMLEQFHYEAPEAVEHKVNLLGYGIVFKSGKASENGLMRAAETANFPLKKGGMKEKKKEVSVLFTFCPFCGVRYEI